MNSIDFHEANKCRILVFSDTFGIEAGNGVARFLHDLHGLADQQKLPIEFVVPGREESAAGLHTIRAPAFTVPGYGKLKVSMPLRHHRKTLERHLKNHRPDCVHVSTPGPFGCLGITLAKRYRLPLVGIYHTDFPAYASAIVMEQLNRLRDQPSELLSPILAKLFPILWPAVGRLSAVNPQLPSDLSTLSEVFSRNAKAFTATPSTAQSLCSFTRRIAQNFFERFYSQFDLVIARSANQKRTLADELKLSSNQIGCLQPGTDVQRFHPHHAERSIWLHHGIPEDAFVVLYVGRITPEKNIGFLHDTWNALQSKLPQRDMRLVMIGHGESDQVSRFRSLDKTHVIGSRSGVELSRLYASSDVVVFPSTTETLGQVGLEAGASGVPVIVSDQGGPQMYVKHGQTGWILPTQDPTVWAEKLIRLSMNPLSLKAQGNAARENILHHHTLQHSLHSYWNLHHQATKRKKARPKAARRLKIKTVDLTSRQGQLPKQGLMVISDFHAGKRCGNETHRSQKRDAVEAMLTMAMEQELEVVFGGDFGDHGSRTSRLESDFANFRKVREKLGFGGRPVFVRGNHDYGYTDERLNQLTGGCQVHESLVYHHPKSKVTICHGHIFGLAKTLEVIQSASDAQYVMDQLHEDCLDEDLKPAVIAYDIANMIETGLAEHGLRGLSTAWEGVYKYRAMLAEKLLKLAGSSDETDEATWKMIANLVGTHDNIEVAGMLGAACGGWASLFGHTHEPLAKRTSVRLLNRDAPIAQMVGNSGHINRKHATCVVAKFPQVTVYSYHPATKQLQSLRQRSMSESEIEAFVKQTNSNRPSHCGDEIKEAESQPFAVDPTRDACLSHHQATR